MRYLFVPALALGLACAGETNTLDAWDEDVDQAFSAGDLERLQKLAKDAPKDGEELRLYADCPFDDDPFIVGLKARLAPVIAQLDDKLRVDAVDFCYFFGQAFVGTFKDKFPAMESFLDRPDPDIPFPVRVYVDEPGKDVTYDAFFHKLRLPIRIDDAVTEAVALSLEAAAGRSLRPDLSVLGVPTGATLAGEAQLKDRYDKTVSRVALDDTLPDGLGEVLYFVMPDFQGAISSEPAREALLAFVESGGQLISMYSNNNPDYLNAVFGWSLGFNQGSFSTATLVGTEKTFAGAPASITQFNDFDAVTTSTLPADAEVIYQFDASNAGIVRLPVGKGVVYFVGEARALDTADTAWVDVMGRMIP